MSKVCVCELDEVNHTHLLSSSIGSLFLESECSDVVVIVEERHFPTHKIILASRSPYFRALFFGGLSESSPQTKDITLQNTSAPAFEIILKYIYTGRMKLVATREELVLDVLELAHRYHFLDLETDLCSYLGSSLAIDNVCSIYNMAKFYEFTRLRDACAQFMDTHGEDMLRGSGYLSLSLDAFTDIISRDSFCAKEVDIARAVARWTDTHQEESNSKLMEQIRLPLMTIQELLQVVRPLGLITSDLLLDAIASKTCSRDTQLNYRGFRMVDVNVLTTYHGAQVTCGELGDCLLDGDVVSYDLDHGFTRHRIDDPEQHGIVVKLGAPSIINHMKLLLWDRDRRSYSYYVEISVDQQDWVKVIDYSHYLCRSWQKLYFPQRVAKYIRVVGTHNTVNRVFHLVHMEAMYVNNLPPINPIGVQIPKENVATIAHGAMVIEGISRTRNALINGDTVNYDWDSGYTCHQLGDGYILLSLSQPYIIGSMRLLLWDCDDRSYSYYIDVSTNLNTWHRVVDKGQVLCQSWQQLSFPARPVSHIKIVGTRNTANEVFHCVHFECPDISSVTAYNSLVNMSKLATALSSQSSAPQSSASQTTLTPAPRPLRSVSSLVGPCVGSGLSSVPGPSSLPGMFGCEGASRSSSISSSPSSPAPHTSPASHTLHMPAWATSANSRAPNQGLDVDGPADVAPTSTATSTTASVTTAASPSTTTTTTTAENLGSRPSSSRRNRRQVWMRHSSSDDSDNDGFITMRVRRNNNNSNNNNNSSNNSNNNNNNNDIRELGHMK